MEINVQIDDRAVRAGLERLQRRVTNLAPAMTAIGLFYERSVVENFQAEASPDGTPWQRLSATTLQLGLARHKGFGKRGGLTKRGTGYLQGKRILWEHGDLEGSVHSQADNSSVTIGAGGHLPYAAIHQFGGQAGRGRKVTIPARPYLALNQGDGLALAAKDQARVVEIIEGHIAAF